MCSPAGRSATWRRPPSTPGASAGRGPRRGGAWDGDREPDLTPGPDEASVECAGAVRGGLELRTGRPLALLEGQAHHQPLRVSGEQHADAAARTAQELRAAEVGAG